VQQYAEVATPFPEISPEHDVFKEGHDYLTVAPVLIGTEQGLVLILGIEISGSTLTRIK
jgi:hypothetical protein